MKSPQLEVRGHRGNPTMLWKAGSSIGCNHLESEALRLLKRDVDFSKSLHRSTNLDTALH